MVRAHVAEPHPKLVLAVTARRDEVVVVDAGSELLCSLGIVLYRLEKIDILLAVGRVVLEVPVPRSIRTTFGRPDVNSGTSWHIRRGASGARRAPAVHAHGRLGDTELTAPFEVRRPHAFMLCSDNSRPGGSGGSFARREMMTAAFGHSCAGSR